MNKEHKAILFKDYYKRKKEIHSQDQEYTSTDLMIDCDDYLKFAETPLELGQFVPCLEGNVLEEPKKYEDWRYGVPNELYSDKWLNECRAYQEAKERVIFEGWYLNENLAHSMWQEALNKKQNMAIVTKSVGATIFAKGGFRHIKTIEDLIPYELTLTQKKAEELKLN